MATKKNNNHICSECIDEFLPKDIFVAMRPGMDHFTVYCADCLKKLNIKEFVPYLNPRKPRKSKV